MGYAGYAPGANSKMGEARTPLQEALRQLPLDKWEATLELIEKLTRNVVRNPSDDKFRRIKLTNPKIAAAITDVPNALALLKEMGWVQEGEELVLPSSVRLVHETEVVGIIDAKDFYKKEAEKEHRRQMMERKEKDPEKELLRKQLEADRQEKAAQGPVTQGSVAKKLGDGVKMTAGDIGIGKSGGG
eukprot:TRINITY_DN653_c0_g1_i2.p1 TRINITY_DN653_c0_g1~~TRINITY_DN653_c0_g1_i2.p1  ORF type:complete len:187 (-),score=65.76 TRINITY_DN653_c0_g1_i2:553-1113(-)